MWRLIKYLFLLLLILALCGFLLSFKSAPADVTYGVSFSKYHSDELGLPWQETFQSILSDLKVKHLRLSAHWPMIEPDEDRFDWEVLDQEMNMAKDAGADVILAVGWRLPGWPECHTPGWAQKIDGEQSPFQAALEGYITEVVNRYKDYPNLLMWQVENEPYLTLFATDHCSKLGTSRLNDEIALVRRLDPDHQILVTDSGELGTWFSAAKQGDQFGTSIYLYVWNHKFGQMRYPIGPWFFRIKQNLLNVFGISKSPIAIEVSAEPWLLTPIKDASVETQLSQMNIDRFKEMIDFSKKAGFSKQYLWGAEWWYYMREKGHPEFWEYAKEVFN